MQYTREQSSAILCCAFTVSTWQKVSLCRLVLSLLRSLFQVSISVLLWEIGGLPCASLVISRGWKTNRLQKPYRLKQRTERSTSGGNQTEYMPKFRRRYDVSIVVPYRNREQHLNLWNKFVADALGDLVEIVLVKQVDTLPFNRGCLLNIGFKHAPVNALFFTMSTWCPTSSSCSNTAAFGPRPSCTSALDFRATTTRSRTSVA